MNYLKAVSEIFPREIGLAAHKMWPAANTSDVSKFLTSADHRSL